MSFTELFESGKDYIKSKFVNPLFSTILAIWLVRNWKVWFGIFTFDDSSSQITKIAFIDDYFKKINWYCEIWTCLSIAFIVLIISYVFLALSKFLLNIYEEKLIPIAYKFSPKSKMVTRELFNEIQNQMTKNNRVNRDEIAELLKDNNSMKANLIEGEQKVLSLNEKLVHLEMENAEMRSELTKINGRTLQSEFEEIISKSDKTSGNSNQTITPEIFEQVFNSRINKTTLLNIEHPKKEHFRKAYSLIVSDKELLGQCKNLINAIETMEFIKPNNILTNRISEILLSYGFIRISEQKGSNIQYSFTPVLGQAFVDLIKPELPK